MLAAGAVALALLGTACGERKEPVGRTVPGAYPLTVQAADEHPVTIRKQPRSVLPVSATAASILDALGLRGLVPGADPDGTEPLKARRVTAIAKTPVDLVLGSQLNDANALQAATADAKETVVVVADSSVVDLEHSILQVGLALGVPVRARALVARIDAQLAAVKKKLAGQPAVPYFLDKGFYIPLADDTFGGELLRLAGGKNIAAGAEPIPYRIKYLLRDDPAVYLATEASGTTLETLRKTPRVKRLTAVREGRFALLDEALLQPTAAVGDQVEQLYELLHGAPEAPTEAPAEAPATTTEPAVAATETTG